MPTDYQVVVAKLEGGGDRQWLGHAGALYQQVVEAALGREPAHLAQEVVPQGAADAAVGQLDELLLGATELGAAPDQVGMSLTMTATRRPSRLFSTWFSRVVFPAPRKPERTVTGRRRSVMRGLGADFLARGGDGYDMLRDASRLLQADDSPMIANEAMAHLRRIGTVHAGVEGRIVLK